MFPTDDTMRNEADNKTRNDPAGLDAVRAYLEDLQERIVSALGALDPQMRVQADEWRREGGDGHSWALYGDGVFEKGGVNVSRVNGHSLPTAATRRRPELAGLPYEAMGISLVLHPRNPYVPTTHANLRYLQVAPEAPGTPPAWWFGGGFDLTPYYGFKEDARHWHRTARKACLPFGPEVYPRFKRWCDEYFYLPHRNEPRGIGGLFFDDLNEWGFEDCFAFVRGVGDRFLPAYLPIVERRRDVSYGSRERDFQLYRRGRYVEFNLIHDRGTLFGLQSGGRIESIFMSLPPVVRWVYDWHPEPGSPEARLYEEFLQPREWVE